MALMKGDYMYGSRYIRIPVGFGALGAQDLLKSGVLVFEVWA